MTEQFDLSDTVFARCVQNASERLDEDWVSAMQGEPDNASQGDLESLVPDERGRCCLLRIPNDGGWCVMADGHSGECTGYPSREATVSNTFGPADAVKRGWGQ
jgi:hypothetical protein